VADVTRLAADHPVHLLIVCYTAKPAECDEAVRELRAVQPEVKVALLASIIGRDPKDAPPHSHILVENSAEFTRSVRMLLNVPERRAKPEGRMKVVSLPNEAEPLAG
jgi:hypothetical protein